MNIKFNYLYRDGANYKNHNSIVFANPNQLTLEKVEKCIVDALIDGQWFIVSVWKVPDMHFREYPYDSEIDHDWHEFSSVENTLEGPTEKASIDRFLERIMLKNVP